MKRTVLATILILTSWSGYADNLSMDDSLCSQVFLNTYKAGKTVNEHQINEFLGALGCEYFSSAEGGEFGNELLFSIVLSHPEIFLKSFSNQERLIQNIILVELERPVHDGIDLAKVRTSVSNAHGDKKVKERILNAIKVPGTAPLNKVSGK